MASQPSAIQSQSDVKRCGLPKCATCGYIIGLGLYLAVLLVVLIYLLLALWPEVVAVPASDSATVNGSVSADDSTSADSSANTDSKQKIFWKPDVRSLFGISIDTEISDEVRTWLIVLFAGAIGNMIHTIRSFVNFAGNRQLVISWIPWYVLRPASGAALALLFYFVIRGLTDGKSVSDGLPVDELVGIAGLAGLVGLFNDMALEKLKDIFTAILSSREPSRTSDPLTANPPNPKPEVSELVPPGVLAGTTDLSVTIIGSKFVAGAKAHVDGQSRSTEVKSDTEIVFLLITEDVAAAGDKKVTVVNPIPGGGESEPEKLPVT